MSSSSGSSESPKSPSYLLWSRSLTNLLASSTGSDLFEEYLTNEGISNQLQFLWAVEGLQGMEQEGNEAQLKRTIDLIYEHLLPGLFGVSESTREAVSRKVKEETSITIFNTALDEVKEHMRKNLFPNFLKSDIYLNAISTPSSAPPPPLPPPNPPSTSFVPTTAKEELLGGDLVLQQQHSSTDLQTVHEEEVLNIRASKSKKLTKELLRNSQKVRLSKTGSKGEGGSSGVNPYHTTYSSYNPVSRQDSEIQSLSSGCTEESVELRRKNRHHQHHYPSSKQKVNFPKDEFQPLPVPKMEVNKNIIAEKDPKAFARILCERLERALRDRKKEEERRNLQEITPTTIANAFGKQKHFGIAEKHNIPTIDPESEQEILDQHVSRVWADATPEYSRSPKNEATDLRRTKRIITQPPPFKGSMTTMVTVDSGVVPDYRLNDFKNYKARPPPQRRLPESFVDSGVSECGSSAYRGKTSASSDRVSSWVAESVRRPIPLLPQNVLGGSSGTRVSPPPVEETTTVYVYYGSRQEQTPEKLKITASKLTLGLLKSKLSRKGNFKYFFKRVLSSEGTESQVVNEVTRDDEVLPMYKGNVVVAEIQPPDYVA